MSVVTTTPGPELLLASDARTLAEVNAGGKGMNLARLSAEGYLRQREAMGYPLLNRT